MTALAELTLLAGAPLLLAAIGELVLQRSGVLNIGLEGMVLSGAFGGVAAAAATGSIAAGIAGALAGAALPAAGFGALAIGRRTDPIVAGVALNLLCLGATSVLYREWNDGNRLVEGLPRLPRLPFGPVAIDPLTLIAWAIAPLLAAGLLWHSRSGLHLRAAGENPEALGARGGSVAGVRWLALGVETILAGLAGFALALGLANGFAENMVAGRGYIALAIVIFARWRLRGAIAGVALFAFATALQYAIQAGGGGIPYHLLLAVPYLVTIAILLALPGRADAPAALGKR